MLKRLSVLLMTAFVLLAISLAEVEKPEDIPCYGIPTEASTLIYLTNRTEKAIIMLQIKPVVKKDEIVPEEIPDLLGEELFLPDEKIGIWFDLSGCTEQKLPEPLYEIILTQKNNKSWTLHNVPVTDMTDADLWMDENVMWLTYTSLTTGEEISTWLDELRILAQEEADDSRLEEDAEPEDHPGDNNWKS